MQEVCEELKCFQVVLGFWQICIQIPVKDKAMHQLKMQKAEQTQSSQDINLKEVQAGSPNSLAQGQAEPAPTRGMWTLNIKRCMLLLMFVICSTLLGYEINAQTNIITNEGAPNPAQFNFLVFCPVSQYRDGSFTEEQDGDDLRVRRLRRLYKSYASNRIVVIDEEDYNPQRTYLVQASSYYYNTTGADGKVKSTAELFYCGLARGFYDTCQNAQVACSSPGPMFDIPTREAVDIIWVNNLDPDILPDVTGSCLDPKKDNNYCTLMGKSNRTQTYFDPTKNDIESKVPYKHVRISKNTWPMTTHLHGAEIRPTFDGNPLSWLDNGKYDNGNLGTATFSMTDECYYDAFDNIGQNNKNFNPPRIKVKDLPTGMTKKNFKINRYPNQQNPGTLWYHDHAMHLTSYNVAGGLAGFYILRDPKVERQIGVDRQYEKLVMLTELKMMPSFELKGFEVGVVYRFRFLNNNFDDGNMAVVRISFSYEGCKDSIKNREVFSIIGADSSLFDRSIDNQRSFVISHAQRIEILIKFQEGKNFAICEENYTSSVGIHKMKNADNINTPKKNSDNSIKNIELKVRDQSIPCPNKRTDINNVKLNVAYTDLSKVPDTEIAVKRMRPLLAVGGGVSEILTIHGRVDFHKGESENPTMGTIQDWFIINTIYVEHPIHFHLINFQVVKEYSLTLLQGASSVHSIYELDFVATALKLSKGKDLQKYRDNTFKGGAIDYLYLCDNVVKITENTEMHELLSSIYPENVVDPKTRVSGLDLFSTLTPKEVKYFKGLNMSVPINTTGSSPFKYITNSGVSPARPFYSKWKDTAYLEVYKVLQYRIRWAKANFTETDKVYGNYFNVPADQLREYPGFVYHCHILPHEDNQMMRPIMLQLPPNAKLNKKTPCNYDIQSKQPALKWKDKYNCINKRCGNRPT